MKTKVFLPQLEVEVDGATQADLFQAVSEVQEVFGENNCGQCKSENIYYRVREVDDNKYYELVCRDCGAVLAFGQMKKGGKLFPKRKLDADGRLSSEGKYDNVHRGWTKYKPASKS